MRLPYFRIKDRVPTGGLRGANDIYNLINIGFAFGVAALTAAGGPRRWQGEQFEVARQIPFSPYSWAIVLGVGAMLYTIGVLLREGDDEARWGLRGLFVVAGAFICAAWCIAFAWCLYQSGLQNPTQVSLSGPFLWATYSVFYVIKVGQHLEFRVTGSS